MGRLTRQLGLWLAVLLLAACSASPQAPAAGDPAPDFTLSASDGSMVSLSDYQGQPVLLYFHMAVG